ncbi:hypothetical protein Ae201684P_016116 [Aphanomyces euteiches]|nr:hypothetical protein Ae201684P_016116 [Aphanomyces euteiches]KAH9140531.1 hypothetical protein AeRB84_015245 [Aphanomyces euteiches]
MSTNSDEKRAPAKPKTIDVAGRALTMSLLQEIDVTKQQRALAREEAKELRSTREKKVKEKAAASNEVVDPSTRKHHRDSKARNNSSLRHLDRVC